MINVWHMVSISSPRELDCSCQIIKLYVYLSFYQIKAPNTEHRWINLPVTYTHANLFITYISIALTQQIRVIFNTLLFWITVVSVVVLFQSLCLFVC